MTCSNCGAQMGTLDTNCGSCGVATPATERLPLPPLSILDTTPAPRRRRTSSTKVLAIVAGVAVVVAVGIGASRVQVAGRLSTSDADLRDTRGQLDASTTQVKELETRVQELEAAQADLHTQLDDSHTEARDTQTSLTACQVFIRIAAKFASDGPPPKSMGPKFASTLLSCFEGKVPPSLF